MGVGLRVCSRLTGFRATNSLVGRLDIELAEILTPGFSVGAGVCLMEEERGAESRAATRWTNSSAVRFKAMLTRDML